MRSLVLLGAGGGGVIVTTAQGGDGEVFWWGWEEFWGEGQGFFAVWIF